MGTASPRAAHPAAAPVAVPAPSSPAASPGVSPRSPGASAAAAAGPRCATLGNGVSELTGERRPTGTLLAVKINNMTGGAWPQSGLQAADMDFVEEIENGYTRHIALFSSSYPARVGSVRSARETDLDLLAGFGRPALVFSGAAREVKRLLPTSAVVPLQESDPGRGFTRDAAVGARKGPTHNLFADLTALRSIAAARGARPTAAQQWCFGPALAGGRPTDLLEMRWPLQGVQARWDARTGRYRVWYTHPTSAGWTPTPAMTSGAQLTARNVVLLLSTRSTVRPAYVGSSQQTTVPKTATVGSGQALVMRDGVLHRARWSRASPAAPLRLIALDGRPFPLATGNTLVLLGTQDRWVLTRPAGATRAETYLLPAGRRIPAGLARLIPE